MVVEKVSVIRENLRIDNDETWKEILEHAKLLFLGCKANESRSQKYCGWSKAPSSIKYSVYTEVCAIQL